MGAWLPGTVTDFTFCIRNIGQSPLRFSTQNMIDGQVTAKILITGRDAQYFKGIDHPSMIAPQHQSNFTIRYAPNSPGSHSATINIMDSTIGNVIHEFRLITKNQLPSIHTIPDQETLEDKPIHRIPIQAFDIENKDNLTIYTKSSDPSLIPNTGIIIQESSSERSMSIIPAPHRHGKTTITVSVHDGFDVVTQDFDVIVTPVNDSPAMTLFQKGSVDRGSNDFPVRFRITDIDNPIEDLTISGTSNNPTLLPDENIHISKRTKSDYRGNVGASSADFIISLNPAPDRSGDIAIAITASDGFNSVKIEIPLTAADHNIDHNPAASLTMPTQYALESNFPNPFNPETTIRFSLPNASQVRLEVHNVRGQLIQTLINENIDAGFHALKWVATNIESGIYIISLQTPEYIQTQKCMLLK